MTVNDANCVREGQTQRYSCLVHYTVLDERSNLNQKYRWSVAGECQSRTNCSWRGTANGEPVAG